MRAREKGRRWTESERARTALLLVAFFLLGMSLRGALGGISALLPMIGDDLELSVTQHGALTSVALASMAAVAPCAPWLGRRIGAERSLMLALAVLTVAEAARFLASSLTALMATVIAVGMAMGVGSTLISTAVRRRVQRRHYGLAIGLHAAGMALGVAAAAAMAIPIAEAAGSWRPALGLWSMVTASTALVWWLVLHSTRPVVSAATSRSHGVGTTAGSLLRSGSAWVVTSYAAVPMVIGFTVLAWLPTMFVEEGLSLAAATSNLVLFQVIQLGSMTMLPVCLDRMATTAARQCVLLVPLVAAIAALVLLIAAPASAGATASTLLGFGAGGGTALGMTLIARFATSDAHAAGLGSMVFAVSFTVSALSPTLVGLSVTLTGGFATGLGVLAGLSLVVLGVVLALFARFESESV